MNDKGVAKKKKREGPDERITARHTWVKDSLFLFIVLLVVNGAHIMIYQEVFEIEQTLQNLLVPELISFLFFAAAVLCLVMSIGRRAVYDEPLEQLGEAARQIAAGDFSVRMPTRDSKKKDLMDILNEDFNTMAEELASTETLKTDFIANVSHEIRTPLAVIHNYAFALKNEELTEEQRLKYLDTIMASSIDMSTLVSNILQLNNLENKEILPDPEPYSLSDQLAECALNYVETWEEKELEFEADIEDDLSICGDRFMMEIVWNQLLANAIKFTNPGGAIKISLKKDGEYAVAEISDTGCGFDEATKKHIFDKFYQGDTSHSQKGNGLGLALVHKIIELACGEISVNSIVGKGSVFTIRLKATQR